MAGEGEYEESGGDRLKICELITFLSTLPGELPVYRDDAEWGPQDVIEKDCLILEVEDSRFDQEEQRCVSFKTKALVIG